MPTEAIRPRVDINGRFLSQRVTGVQRYARETLRCLDELLGQQDGAGIEWRLLLPPGTPAPVLRHVPVHTVGRLKGHAWEQLELPLHSAGRFLFSFGFTGPLLKRRQVITVHDAAVVRQPLSFKPLFRLLYSHLVRHVGQRAALVMAVSRFSCSEATVCFGIPAERLHLTTEGWQHLLRLQADESILDQHALRQRPFVLAVSSPTPNKNFGVMARALAQLGPQAPTCVVVGAADAAVFPTDAPAGPGLLRVGYVSDGQLRALYQAATCFVFPSFYEGFGLPPLEAMASGCPVLCSTAPVLSEVCGDAALYFAPESPAELAECLRKVLGNPALRQRMAASGQQRAQQFSWQLGASMNLDGLQRAVRAPATCHAAANEA